MSLFICVKCENQCVFKSRPEKDELFGAKCDSCKNLICKICANLTTSEAQAVALVSRTLIFHCPECKTQTTTLKRRSQNLDVSDLETEKNLSEETELLKSEIKKIKENLSEVIEQNNIVGNKIADMMKKNENLETKLSELNRLKQKLLSRIQELEKENNLVSDDLKKTKAEYLELQEGIKTMSENNHNKQNRNLEMDGKKTLKTSEITRQSGECKQSNRLVVLTDNFGNHLYNHLSKHLQNCNIQVIRKPGASFKEIVDSCDCYVKDLTNNDYVIMLAGTNDKNVRVSDIKLLTNKCFHTNLILCSVPFNNVSVDRMYHTHVNDKILSVATNLKKFSISLDILDLSHILYGKDFRRFSNVLSKRGLRKLVNYISISVLNFQNSNKNYTSETNLRYININCSQDKNYDQTVANRECNTIIVNFPNTEEELNTKNNKNNIDSAQIINESDTNNAEERLQTTNFLHSQNIIHID